MGIEKTYNVIMRIGICMDKREIATVLMALMVLLAGGIATISLSDGDNGLPDAKSGDSYDRR